MKILYLYLFIILNISVFAQCGNFHEVSCELPFDWDYEFDSQSLSAATFPGKSVAIKAVLYGGNEYYMSICKPFDVDLVKVKMKIDNNELDESMANIDENGNIYYQLAIPQTTTIIIEAKIPSSQQVSYNQSDIKCIGFIIGHKLLEESF